VFTLKIHTKRHNRSPGLKLAVIAGLLMLTGGVLFLKAQSQSSASAESRGEGGPVSSISEMDGLAQPMSTPGLSPEAQFDHILATGKPALAFFHSTTCIQCVQITEIVDQVYPGFADRVTMIDVNVYDQRNANLLRRAGIRVILTLIFIDRSGQGRGHLGVMEADELKKQLQALTGE
jgi:hypothetical protein